ncbi:MAG: carboxypeptidase-like regulatory domain-containing protein, partial [Bryobacteraceae bacterium]
MTPRQLAATAAIAILSGAIIPAAQPDAKPWSGILRDDRRQPIAGATVRLESGGHHETATTAQDGSFAFAALAPASYSIAVAYQGVTAACPQPVQL